MMPPLSFGPNAAVAIVLKSLAGVAAVAAVEPLVQPAVAAVVAVVVVVVVAVAAAVVAAVVAAEQTEPVAERIESAAFESSRE